MSYRHKSSAVFAPINVTAVVMTRMSARVEGVMRNNNDLQLGCLTAQAYNVSMNKLSTDKRCAVVSALVEGCSIRSTVRMTAVAKNEEAKQKRAN